MKHEITTFRFHPITEQWFSQNFQSPTPPQKKGWPQIAAGQHTLILAPTGSGKTLAAFLWCLDDLLRKSLKISGEEFESNIMGVHTLYISPLKALNNDIYYNLQKPLAGIKKTAQEQGIHPPPIRAAVRTGDTPSHVRQSMIKKPPHILITTPESLYLLLTSERGRLIFNHLQYIIVDEIHALINNKRGVHLSLSLERLLTLSKKESTRIGLSATQRPLAKIAAFLGGQQKKDDRFEARPVKIVDCGQRKNLDVKVISPVDNFTELPNASVWPMVIDKLYELITTHQTTLVFVNMRAQSEKIARLLNEKHRHQTGETDAELILAHHGSISREMRYEIEARLKEGKIPAVIATASLELGIDIGSIDLVIQCQSPGSVSSALQRVGRSGHLIFSTSKGRIIPLFQADLDDSVAICQAMLNQDIEESRIPENCLDVLAQHIVAEVSMRDWDRKALFQLIQQSYCYRFLSQDSFNNVLDMLSGFFGHSEIRALQPRITWDKVNDTILSRRGSRLLAVMNGGTIADRGYYGVYLEGSNTRLGEVEEEFVFESKVGDIFFLGNNEWRINEITRDRLVVAPRGSVKPRAPFWKAEPLFREYSTSIKIGRLRETFDNFILNKKSPDSFHADQSTISNLLNYLSHQKEHCGLLPTDKQIVVEYFRDTVGEPQIVVHAVFGGRVIGAWATALAAALETRFQVQVQFTYDDDGMLFRLLDIEESPPFHELMQLSFSEIEKFLVDALGNTPMFTVRFRHNATRALLLQRSRAGKRIPLWLQRLRAADLLQIVRQLKDFPILIETYRDCLKDVFDIDSLKLVINDIKQEKIKINYVHTTSPSPMTSGLLFRFLSEQMYDYDRFRTAGHAAEISSDLLADILSSEDIPAIITQEIIDQVELYWQFLDTTKKAKDKEDIFDILNKLGPMTYQELAERSIENPEKWLVDLQKKNRILKFNKDKNYFISSDYNIFLQNNDFKSIIQKYMHIVGPRTLDKISSDLGIEKSVVTSILNFMHQEKEVVKGRIIVRQDQEYWCDRENFSFLYRQAISARRKSHEPAERPDFLAFLFQWHGILEKKFDLEHIVQKYSGFYFPLYSFERDILTSRLKNDKENLAEQINDGNILVNASQETGGQYRIQFLPRGQGHIFFTKGRLAKPEISSKDVLIVTDFLQENGASLIRDICEGTGKSSRQIESILSTLAKLSLVSCENYTSFTEILKAENVTSKKQSNWNQEIRMPWSKPYGKKYPVLSRQEVDYRLKHRLGRWFLTHSFAFYGKEISHKQRIELQTRLLLQRYGIVVKEFYRRERDLMSWYEIFQILKRMEWQGEIRRGYFIKGLSGIQFALPEAIDILENVQSLNYGNNQLEILSTIDPALPFGGFIDWEMVNSAGEKLNITRSASNFIIFSGCYPLVYCENFGLRLFFLKEWETHNIAELPNQLKKWLKLPPPMRPRKRIEISYIDDHPAVAHKNAALFTQSGFEIEGQNLVLWPSGV